MALHKSNLGRGHTRKLPLFVRELWADMRLLFAPEMPKYATVPSREGFADDAIHSATVKELIRRHRHAVLRQALEKQQIRETLWPRFRGGLLLAAPISYPFCLLLPTIWASGMLANHQVWEWLALNFCAYRIEGWFSQSRHSSRSPPGTDRFVSIHGAPHLAAIAMAAPSLRTCFSWGLAALRRRTPTRTWTRFSPRSSAAAQGGASGIMPA